MRDQEQDFSSLVKNCISSTQTTYSREPDNFSTSSGSLYSELQTRFSLLERPDHPIFLQRSIKNTLFKKKTDKKCKPEDEFTKALSNGSLSSSEFEFNRQQGTLS